MPKLSANDAIQVLRKRPRMFLKRESVSDLFIFLTGYCYGLDAADPASSPHGEDLRAFRNWLASRLGSGPHGELETWLLAESTDEADAFRRFFEFWDEYLRVTGQEHD
jgi:hypothetical protein